MDENMTEQADLMGWLVHGGLKPFDDITIDEDGWHIKTLEGVMLARYGDWIIKGIQGELYPCKSEIFAETYEGVDDDENK